MTERTTVELDESLLRAAEKKAAEEGRTLDSLIEEGLRTIVEERPNAESEPKRYVLPVSKAKGGVAEGFDLSDMTTIYEAEDEEYIERLRTGFK